MLYFRHRNNKETITQTNQKYKKQRGTYTMIINAILLTVGLVGIPAMICGHTELICRAAA